jgi:hypothetical protein
MSGIDRFVGKTLKGFLIVFGLATCLPIVLASNIDFANKHLFSGLLDYGPSSVPGLRHWGMMVFGIGALMVASAFRPWLRFETMLFSIVEKGFMVYLFLINRTEPWSHAYLAGTIVDSTIVLYSLLYFVSSYGRPLPPAAGKK